MKFDSEKFRAAYTRTQVGVAADLYLRDAQFESWPGYWLFGLRFFMDFLSISGVCGDGTLK
jgi:hypothetical protein